MNEFGKMLKYLREREGLSQADFAKLVGLSQGSIAMYETGRREPDFDKEERIAKFFGVSLDTLRGRGEKPVEYYLDEETAKKAQELFDDPDLRVLFDAARDSKPEDLQMAADLLKRLKAANPDG